MTMVDVLTDEYRAGLSRGELLLQRCQDCGRLNMYPKFVCPFCQSEDLGWQRSAGRGVVRSFTISRIGAPAGFEEELPYALAVVRLEEDVQLLGRLVADADGDWLGYSCDTEVEFVAEGATAENARPIAWFRRR
ncbi:Zn-ribbon domain-containing OB-fold protein [Amycolatopsis sp.]|uniref:Zn-ribbon domain-containing OB-fold protein n=1 Tax=Amycolatopsis sp. TaxID=37632 RepID=UPI002BB70A5B|nr:OB-fold domain-containing protein [Amycolatopsis sp.]HVV08261.1 OB-fold domain-containing protein [Amycolatopsis sp.]